jgi:hypothetical protein
MPNKKLLKAIPAILVAFLMLGVFATPVLAASSINSQIETGNNAPLIVTVTPLTQTVTPVIDGNAQATFTMSITDVHGVSDIQNYFGYLAPIVGHANIEVTWGTPVVVGNTETMTGTALIPYSVAAQTIPTIFSGTTTLEGTFHVTAPTVTFLPAIGFSIDTGSSLDFGSLLYSQTSTSLPVTFQSTANTPLKLTGTTPDWSSTNGSASAMPASALNWQYNSVTTPMSNSPVTLAPSIAIGSGTQTANMFVQVPARGTFNMAGVYTTSTTVTGSAA